MPLKLIYLDTNLWNRLMDQNVDPEKLLSDLRAKNATLVLSGHTIYEMSRTFLSSAPGAAPRAQELFDYIKQYVDAGIPYAHDNMQQLQGEVKALTTGSATVDAFFGQEDYKLLRSEVDKLANGILDDKALEFIVGRRRFSESTRSDQKRHLQEKEHVRTRLQTISDEQLSAWLDEQTVTDNGAAILARQLLRIYDEIPQEVVIRIAVDLLRIAPSRLARGVVRADLYYNWRCAQRGSNRKDLVDDLYHVLNASWCHIYATAEPAQADYASLILGNSTEVAIYDGEMPVDEWLISLVNRSDE
jgi:hypothetical protein